MIAVHSDNYVIPAMVVLHSDNYLIPAMIVVHSDNYLIPAMIVSQGGFTGYRWIGCDTLVWSPATEVQAKSACIAPGERRVQLPKHHQDSQPHHVTAGLGAPPPSPPPKPYHVSPELTEGEYSITHQSTNMTRAVDLGLGPTSAFYASGIFLPLLPIINHRPEWGR
ncbi:hypothetical protein RRG08_026045 [Elysia crispata]|uniref:Uncharacterized protein n=1 Tax=Elysia crispata TaxID=231223 RepID=A0AAE1D6Z3_9GAST|nr:hypothetical protein RRG08_026045 [Elysia crispata]